MYRIVTGNGPNLSISQTFTEDSNSGLGIESARTDEAAFHAKYGNDIFSIYPFWAVDLSVPKAAIWVPTIDGHALPGGRFLIRIRKVVGRKTIISTAMDPHGNVSLRLAENSDLINCYRMAQLINNNTVLLIRWRHAVFK